MVKINSGWVNQKGDVRLEAGIGFWERVPTTISNPFVWLGNQKPAESKTSGPHFLPVGTLLSFVPIPSSHHSAPPPFLLLFITVARALTPHHPDLRIKKWSISFVNPCDGMCMECLWLSIKKVHYMLIKKVLCKIKNVNLF